MATLLLIGGTGFFGKSFVDYYKNKTFKKWGIDNFIITSRSKSHNFSDIETFQFDAKCTSDLPDSNFIIYAASSSDSKIYEHHGHSEVFDQNVAINNFGQILKRKNNLDRVLYTSSGSVYGKNNLLSCNTDEIKTVIKPYDNNFPKNIYSEIKVNWENFLLKNFFEKILIARCFAFVGDHLPLDKHFAIGNFIKDIKDNRNINIKSRSGILRSYMHSDDLVEWLLTMVTLKHDFNKFGRIFNVGSPEVVEIHALAKMISNIANRQFDELPFDKTISDKYIPSVKNTQKAFDLNIKIDLKDSIRRLLTHHGITIE